MIGRSCDRRLRPPEVERCLAQAMPVDLLLGYTAAEGVNSPTQPNDAAEFTADIRKTYGNFAERFLAFYPARDDAEARPASTRGTGRLKRRALQIAGRLRRSLWRFESSGSKRRTFKPVRSASSGSSGVIGKDNIKQATL